jgi:hypothetical protein
LRQKEGGADDQNPAGAHEKCVLHGG